MARAVSERVGVVMIESHPTLQKRIFDVWKKIFQGMSSYVKLIEMLLLVLLITFYDDFDRYHIDDGRLSWGLRTSLTENL